MTAPSGWARPAPSAWLDGLRGTGQRARKRRGAVAAQAAGLVVMGVIVMGVPLGLPVKDSATVWVGATAFAAGIVAAVAVMLCRPIPAVTWRARIAGRWHARDLRRGAVNQSGHPSARARRSAVNKAAWAAQRQRDGRAARPEYGSSLRSRMVE